MKIGKSGKSVGFLYSILFYCCLKNKIKINMERRKKIKKKKNTNSSFLNNIKIKGSISKEKYSSIKKYILYYMYIKKNKGNIFTPN